jgi:hypothetical protein
MGTEWMRNGVEILKSAVKIILLKVIDCERKLEECKESTMKNNVA